MWCAQAWFVGLHHKNKKMCTNEKAMQTFSQHLPVPVWQVVSSFEIVMISVLILKTHMHIDYLS